MKRIRHIVSILLLLLLLPGLRPAAAAEAPLVRVGLWQEQASLLLSSTQPFVVCSADTAAFKQQYPAGTKIFIAWKDKRAVVDGKPVVGQKLLVMPVDEKAADAAIEVNRKSYRGTIEINVLTSGLTAVNKISLEQYLYGVMPKEMPDTWPVDALKAQAVAARTFALYSLHKHEAEGFDLCASTHCQVYGGKTVESANATAAVDSTRGETLLYKGKPIYASFHTTSGGMTENSEDVWGSYLPYLRAVPDDDLATPYAKWEMQFTPKELTQKLNTAGLSIGNLAAIELSPLKEKPSANQDRSATGRIKTMRFIGDKGSVTLTGAKVRSALGLKSTLFDIRMIVPEEKKISVPIGQYYKKDIAVNLPPYEERGLYTDSENIRRISGREGELIAIDGRGWGHGLGMSQWGAQMMAKQLDYQAILHHYYTDIEIKKIY